ncbi:MAG TPA: hypothetical protein VGS13_13880 [Stellaceae bacterium]|nr:hypothetical protein [Stellaceae bacterium]
MSAVITAGIEPIVPALPTPFTPSGFLSLSVEFFGKFEGAEIVGAHDPGPERAAQPGLEGRDGGPCQQPIGEILTDCPSAYDKLIAIKSTSYRS